MKELVSLENAMATLTCHLRPDPETEHVALAGAAGRVLAVDVTAEEDMPAWARATMDGYAVRAADTAGSSDDSPRLLDLGLAVAMGQAVDWELEPGQAAPIGTGALLPTGADAVVMVEHTRRAQGGAVEVFRPAGPGENVLGRGHDLEQGDLILTRGSRLRPQEIGLLAALGVTEVPVYRRPRVLVLSTGDELVPPGTVPSPGKFVDVNGPALLAAVSMDGGIPVPGGIAPDREHDLEQVLRRFLEDDPVDMVLLSGGSSVGTRDLSSRVVARLGVPGIIVHGVSVKPGKPTLIAVVGGRPVLGLPGHPVSCLVTYHVIARPVLRYLSGLWQADAPDSYLECRLGAGVASDAGRDEYVRADLSVVGDELVAKPLPRSSAVYSSMVRSDGYIVIPRGRAGLDEGSKVRLYRWPW